MEDNDLRGFVDGRFVAAWNQPGQIHVRLGRKPTSWAKHGDCELFRVLQRWGDLWLPEDATVTTARLVLEIERGVNRDLDVLLYEVNKDWKPGEGGLLRNNNSAPVSGEVWWNEVGRGIQPWGLPGAGFASDSHPDADTPVSPLASAKIRPGDPTICFESRELASYVQRRIAEGRPLLFLLKLSDYLEDIPGASIDVYSANHGDNRNTARRPRLIIDWHGNEETVTLERHVLLEHGRSLKLPRIESKGATGFAVSFDTENGREEPAIYIRGGDDSGQSTEWLHTDLPRSLDWTWLEVRLDACVNPVAVGHVFIIDIRDTWVITGPQEEQEVSCTFFSPSGEQHAVLAEYTGESSWQVRFVPEELGRWRYQWSHNFTHTPYKSPVGRFDVIPGDKDNVSRALNRLVEKMQASELPAGRQRARAFAVEFNRLQRVLMSYETPESFPLNDTHADGGEVGAGLDKAREAMGGRLPTNPRLAIDDPEGIHLE